MHFLQAVCLHDNQLECLRGYDRYTHFAKQESVLDGIKHTYCL